MNPLIAIAGLFDVAAASNQVAEDFESAVFKATTNKLQLPTENDIHKALIEVNERDLLHCDVVVDEGDPISFHSSQPDSIPTFVTRLPDVLSVAGPTAKIKFEVSLEKRIKNGELTLLSVEQFAAHLAATSLKLNLARFSELTRKSNTIRFVCNELTKEFWTESLWFINKNSKLKITEWAKNRETIFSKRNDVCHFENSAELKVIPEDFYLQEKSDVAAINEVFDKLCLIGCLIFVCDIFQMRDESVVFYKLNGYKSITGAIDWDTLDGKLAGTYYKIYQWIYEGGVIDDKIGLARNLLSLHAKRGNLIDLDDEVLTSIRSGYQIYLKENVEQYIEIKNKLIEFVTELSAKAAKLGENLGDSLSKNFIAFFTFFLSVIIIRAISEKDLTVTFSPKLAFIAYALLVTSFLHWIVCLLLLNREIGQMQQNYKSMQNRYSDLLDATDLKNAFNKHGEFRIIVGNIKFKRCLYSCLWIAYIIVFAIVVARLGESDNTASGSANNKSTIVTSTNHILQSVGTTNTKGIPGVPKH